MPRKICGRWGTAQNLTPVRPQPRALALPFIPGFEPHQRGLYTGAVGWVRSDGQSGKLFVALRCARLKGSSARAFAGAGVVPQVTMTARDANLIKTYVRAGLGAGLLAEMAVTHGEDSDLRIIPAPAEIPECITWAVIPRGRVLRDYALSLLHWLAPQLDRRDLRRVLDGNQAAAWPVPPTRAPLPCALPRRSGR